MGDFVFNISKGRHAARADLPETSDALIGILLVASGLESDATLIDYDTVAALLAGASNEASFTGYSRFTLSNVSVTVDDANDRVVVDADNPAAITNTDSAVAVGKLIVAYDDDTGGGTDANLIPMYGLDCVVTFDTDVATTIQFGANGIGTASEPA